MRRPAPLDGVRVVELGGIGPAPFAGMLLAEFGAEVIRIDRGGPRAAFMVPAELDLLNRGKKSVVLDLKQPLGREAARRFIDASDLVIEGFRPGVAERLGVGPVDCLDRKPSLVYGRMTGWGQEGPLAGRAGHDINYIALSGALHAIGGVGGPPQIPLNLVGDFGGGANYLVMGLLAALLDVRATGCGRVIDAAIVDGASHLMASTHMYANAGEWTDRRGVNQFDGGAPFYSVYETADRRHMAVGAVEPEFYRQLLECLAAGGIAPEDQYERETWPATRAVLQRIFSSEDQAHWTRTFADVDACVTPVLSMNDALDDAHISVRGTLVRDAEGLRSGRAPRFSEMSARSEGRAPQLGEHSRELLEAHGMSFDELVTLGASAGVREMP